MGDLNFNNGLWTVGWGVPRFWPYAGSSTLLAHKVDAAILVVALLNYSDVDCLLHSSFRFPILNHAPVNE